MPTMNFKIGSPNSKTHVRHLKRLVKLTKNMKKIINLKQLIIFNRLKQLPLFKYMGEIPHIFGVTLCKLNIF